MNNDQRLEDLIARNMTLEADNKELRLRVEALQKENAQLSISSNPDLYD